MCKINKIGGIQMNNESYISPDYGKDGFTCPNCQVYAHQVWTEIEKINVRKSEYRTSKNLRKISEIIKSNVFNQEEELVDQSAHYKSVNTYLVDNTVALSTCSRCYQESFWVNGEIVFPNTSITPQPHNDMPEEVKEVYNEARGIHNISPRASAALLRLALEKLLPLLGAEGKDINNMIGDLVGKGLNKSVEQALDGLRFIGNEAVHPGMISLQDDKQISFALFKILNYIVQQLITEIREIQSIHDLIPEGKKQGIEARNSAALKNSIKKNY